MIDMNRDTYVYFPEDTKAFDKVRHEEMIIMLETLNFKGNSLRVNKNLCCYQNKAMEMANQLANFQHIKQGV